MRRENNKFTPELNEQSVNLEPKNNGFEIYDSSQPDKVNSESLYQFEAASWSEEEMTRKEDLEKKLNEFPEGISMLFDTDQTDGQTKAMAQFTMAPKEIPNDIEDFEQMRDLPVSLESLTLGTLISPEGLGQNAQEEVMRAKLSNHGFCGQKTKCIQDLWAELPVMD